MTSTPAATKLGRATFARICPLADVDLLVTDRDVDAETAADLAAAGVEVMVAPAVG